MIKEAIGKLVDGRSLGLDEAAQVMEEIMAGDATPAQMGAFLTVLRVKGETVDEIAGLAAAMRARAVPVTTTRPVVDTCGTGGDARGSFNISTAAAFVAAAAGVAVAKHGNRAMSSSCGSADVLEALGVNVNLSADQVARCVEQVGIGFMFAPLFHPAMRHAAGPRRELGFRTVFNVLGPLTNPAGAGVQIVGVYDAELVPTLACVLRDLGSEAAFVVNGADGLDELSLAGPNTVAVLQKGQVHRLTLDPAHYGLARADKGALRGGDATENAAILRDVLGGAPGPRRDAVLLNAAMALVAAEAAADPQEGLARAAASIDSGAALRVLDALIAYTAEAAQ